VQSVPRCQSIKYRARPTDSFNGLFQLWKVAWIHGKYSSIDLTADPRNICQKRKPAPEEGADHGFRCLETRKRVYCVTNMVEGVSDVCLNQPSEKGQPQPCIYRPSEDSFILHASEDTQPNEWTSIPRSLPMYPTCPGRSDSVFVSSGCMTPISVMSYFFRE
jgi:hypothetical protein